MLTPPVPPSTEGTLILSKQKFSLLYTLFLLPCMLYILFLLFLKLLIRTFILYSYIGYTYLLLLFRTIYLVYLSINFYFYIFLQFLTSQNILLDPIFLLFPYKPPFSTKQYLNSPNKASTLQVLL